MSRRVLPWTLGLLGAACAFGCLVLGLWFVLNRNTGASPAWQYPQEVVNRSKVRPGVAVMALTGDSEAVVLEETLAQGDWHSALALLAYSPTLSDTVRVGTLLLLASRLAAAQETEAAGWAWQYVVLDSILSPALSDLTRVQNLLQAAHGFRQLKMTEAARLALDRAYLIADYSLAIPAQARALELRNVSQAYLYLGAANLAAQALDRANEAARSPDSAVLRATVPPPPPLPPLPPDDRLRAAVQARAAAARALAEEASPDARKVPLDLVETLGARLVAEDRARTAYYQTQLRAAREPELRVALLISQVEWLALKWRAARQAFGVSLAPQWESEAADIEGALGDTLNALFQEQEASASRVAAALRDRALEAVLRRELILSRLGLDRGYVEAELRGRLDEVTERLRERNPEGMFVDALPRDGLVHYLLVPNELFGAGERALPR